jgi:hypothetical protein
VQLLEHRVVDAAVPVQNVAVQVPSHGAVDLEVRTHDTPPFALPRAPNMTARRKCDPDAWTGVLVQPLQAVAEGSVGDVPAVTRCAPPSRLRRWTACAAWTRPTDAPRLWRAASSLLRRRRRRAVRWRACTTGGWR